MMYITSVVVIILGCGIFGCIYKMIEYKKELDLLRDVDRKKEIAIDALGQIKEIAIGTQKMRTMNLNGSSAVTPVELYNSFNLIVQIIELPTVKNLINNQEEKIEKNNKNDKNCN